MRCCLWDRMRQLSSWSQHSCPYLQETCRRSDQSKHQHAWGKDSRGPTTTWEWSLEIHRNREAALAEQKDLTGEVGNDGADYLKTYNQGWRDDSSRTLAFFFFQRTVIQFLAPTSGSSQLPITPTPGNPTTSSGLQEYCTNTHKNKVTQKLWKARKHILKTFWRNVSRGRKQTICKSPTWLPLSPRSQRSLGFPRLMRWRTTCSVHYWFLHTRVTAAFPGKRGVQKEDVSAYSMSEGIEFSAVRHSVLTLPPQLYLFLIVPSRKKVRGKWMSQAWTPKMQRNLFESVRTGS